MYELYEIKCTENNRCYYGRSQELEKRWRAHVNMLRTGKHNNHDMQIDWNMYKESSFVFTRIAQFNDLNMAITEEQRLIDLGVNNYNISNAVTGGDTFSNNPRKEEIRKLKSINSKGDKNPMYGKAKSERMINSVKEANSKKIIAGGIKFSSLTEASKYYEIPISTVSYRVKAKSFHDWSLSS